MDAVKYKNGNKNNWRRTAWNVIADHTPNKRNAIVLYLPGSTDLDRVEAIRRGFTSANLIAIERNEAVAKHLRAQGVTVIVGDLNGVLASWPLGKYIDVVVADFQCGITKTVVDFFDLWTCHPALAHAGVVVNMQRGRDKEFAHLVNPGEMQTLFDAVKFTGVDAARWLSVKHGLFNVEKSRSNAAMSLAFSKISRAHKSLYEKIKSENDLVKFVVERRGEELVAEAKDLKRRVEVALDEGFCPKKAAEFTAENEKLQTAKTRLIDFVNEGKAKVAALLESPGFRISPLPSYRSSPQSPVFDSIFVRVNGNELSTVGSHHDPEFANYMRAEWRDIIDRRWPQRPFTKHVSAALALRTRRLRGELRAAA